MQHAMWIAGGYALASCVTFCAYGLDKHRAIRGRRRIRERTLHAMEFLGGWPGAIVGQTVFRHKRRKLSYMVVFVGIIGVHAAAWAAWWRMGG